MENAKLSDNYFITDCNNLLVCSGSSLKIISLCSLSFRFILKPISFVTLNQKIAAVLDQLPLSLHDKYLFCMR